MEAVFIRLLNMSIAASWLILTVIALRFLLKNAPKNIRRVLWALVGIRLVFPFSPESFLSLIPSAETVSPDILYAETPEIHSGISVFNTAVNPALSGSLAPAADASVNPMQVAAFIASVVWMAGMAVLLLYAAVSCIRLRRKVAEAVPFRDNLWQSGAVVSPFVLGLFRPRIYLPFGMDEESLSYVVAHERAHIKRRDHWIKPIGFLILTVYWFNPLIWLAYILLCRDIELACDERVVKRMSADDKKAYSKALLTCSIGRRAIAACPLAFGEVGVKQRVISVLNYKKPAFWIIVAALTSCVAVAVCFLSNPKEHESMQWAKNLQAGDIEKAELVDLLNAEDERYHLYQPEEYPDIVELVNSSRGRYVSKPVSTTGYLTYIYITTKDGVRHSFVNCKNSYLLIDGDVYDADTQWLLDWSYFGGDSPLPEGFFGAEDAVQPVINYALPAGEYISGRCVYMNPLSSYFAFDGDNGLRYVLGEDSLAIMAKDTGELQIDFSGLEPSWSVIGSAELAALFPMGFGMPDISGCREALMLKLSSEYYLFNMDDELWIGEYHGDTAGMWSIYSLVLESDAGVDWSFTPILSSRVPAFPFRFSLDYTRIEAECTGGHLIGFDDHDGTGYPQGKTLAVPAGSALYWSPTAADADPAIALTAQISFTVYNGDESVSAGVLTISGTTGTGTAAAYYNAVLSEGEGLKLVGTPDADGALICAEGTYPTASAGGIGWPQHLTVAHGDLDGDGTGESVTATKTADDLYVLSVLKADGSELWREEMSTAHAGWDTLFLCTLDGKDYLLRYNPAMFQGECAYQYTLFSLENGRENVKLTGTVEFDVNGTKLLDTDKMTAFADEVNALLEKSILLLSTQGGIVSVGPSGAPDYRENYAVLFESGASDLAEAAVIRAAQVFIRQEAEFDTILNFDSPELNGIDASRFSGIPLFTEDYDADGPLYEVTFYTSDDGLLGPVVLFVDSRGTVFGSPGRD